MREIKFRAFYEKRYYRCVGVTPTSILLYSDVGNKLSVPQVVGEIGKDCDDIQIEQFTGLHDKNGKEIYEGDRVRVSHGCRHYWLFEIKALGGQFGNNLYGVCYEHNLSTTEDDSTYTYEKVTGEFYRSECMGGKDSEVIGNIHENGDLIHG